MATVWKAWDTLLGRFVAVKRLLPHLAGDPDGGRAFQEGSPRGCPASAIRGSSPCSTPARTPMGLHRSGTRRRHQPGGHLAHTGPSRAQTVDRHRLPGGRGLDHAHGVGRNPSGHQAGKSDHGARRAGRIADFGIAQTVDDPATITSSGELVGTITYLAPEILAGRPATPASDIYSLGAVTFELLSGQPPYRAPHAPRSSKPFASVMSPISVASPPTDGPLQSPAPWPEILYSRPETARRLRRHV